MGVRYYDPTVGRFTRLDPAGQGANRYVYAGNAPASMVDPSGLREVPNIGSPVPFWGDFWDEFWAANIGLYYDNWFRFYFVGQNQVYKSAYSLAELGVSDYFWAHTKLKTATQRFKNDLRYDVTWLVRKRARQACRGHRFVALKTLAKRDRTAQLNFTSDVTLLPLGHTNVDMKGFCGVALDCCNHRYTFTCQTMYHLHDRFWDVRDIFRPEAAGPQELPGGHPYDIYGYDGEQFSGEGTF